MLLKLLKAEGKFKIDGLYEVCSNYTLSVLNTVNVMDIINCMTKFKDHMDLTNKNHHLYCRIRVRILNMFDDIIKKNSSLLNGLSLDDLEDLVTDEHLKISNETALWQWINEYISYGRPNRDEKSTTLKNKIRMKLKFKNLGDRQICTLNMKLNC